MAKTRTAHAGNAFLPAASTSPNSHDQADTDNWSYPASVVDRPDQCRTSNQEKGCEPHVAAQVDHPSQHRRKQSDDDRTDDARRT